MPGGDHLIDLGWDERLADGYQELAAVREIGDSAVPGRVVRVDRSACTVATEAGEVRAEIAADVFRADAAGALGQPAVGDWVVLETGHQGVHGSALISAVLPRHGVFARQGPDGQTVEQVVAANIDTVFVVSPASSDQRLRRIERYLALAWQSGATPVVLLTKSDLCPDPAELLAEVSTVAVGVDVHAVSAVDGSGVEAVRAYLARGRTVALVGPSGAGKSTLVNLLAGQELMSTQDIRSDGKGRHTTTHRELIRLPGCGLLIDTPGMRALAPWDVAEGIGLAFHDIEELSEQCSFTDCGHTGEPGCAVQSAVRSGALSSERLSNYEKLQREQKHQELRRDARAMAEEKQRIRVRARALKKRPHR
ncbi:ribosome small subunit-dependent GTPase A [Streptomyces sp. NPDC004658]|uniref:ribosome small subunit-dependent GTPase A n=1 Tax=Streptomyces sp. NPDC004658 TaxID=3154672 RepID=UPI0033ABB698